MSIHLHGAKWSNKNDPIKIIQAQWSNQILPQNISVTFCTSSSPCPAGGGDCDADSDCGPGLSILNASNNVSVSIYSQAESENCSQVLFVATIIVLDPSSFTTMTAVEIQYVTFQNLNFQWKFFAEWQMFCCSKLWRTHEYSRGYARWTQGADCYGLE